MKRGGFAVVVLLMGVLTLVLPQHEKTSPESLIQVGDRADDAKSKIKEWGWRETNFAWAYGITEWQGSAEATRALSEERAQKLRAENDFNDQPYFSIGQDENRRLVNLRASYGIVVSISKGHDQNGEWEWTGGYNSVSCDGVFKR